MRNHKQSLLLLFASFELSPLLYVVLAYQLMAEAARNKELWQPNHAMAGMAPIFLAVAGVATICAVFVAQTRLRSNDTVAHFQTQLLIGLAFSEVPSIVGLIWFLLSKGHLSVMFPYVGLSLLVGLLFYLPKVLSETPA